jgi:2-aminoadipate transaminase
MRLNFSGVGEDDIREGIRRIGEVVSEQVALYGTLTGARPALARAPAAPSPGSAEAPKPDPELAKVLRFSAKRQAG